MSKPGDGPEAFDKEVEKRMSKRLAQQKGKSAVKEYCDYFGKDFGMRSCKIGGEIVICEFKNPKDAQAFRSKAGYSGFKTNQAGDFVGVYFSK